MLGSHKLSSIATRFTVFPLDQFWNGSPRAPRRRSRRPRCHPTPAAQPPSAAGPQEANRAVRDDGQPLRSERFLQFGPPGPPAQHGRRAGTPVFSVREEAKAFPTRSTSPAANSPAMGAAIACGGERCPVTPAGTAALPGYRQSNFARMCLARRSLISRWRGTGWKRPVVGLRCQSCLAASIRVAPDGTVEVCHAASAFHRNPSNSPNRDRNAGCVPGRDIPCSRRHPCYAG